MIPRIVTSEATQSPWFVDEYLAEHFTKEQLDHKKYVGEWGEVLSHFAASPFYSDKALFSERGWANEGIADGWLIAIAKKDGLTIVTDEVANPGLNRVNPSKSCKIPDVARGMGVRCISMLTFFKEVGLEV